MKKVVMNKEALIKEIQLKVASFPPEQVALAVESILSEMSNALICGDRIEIRGFGSLNIKRREAKKVRNPRNGEYSFKSEGNYVFFRASRELIKKLNFAGSNDN